MVDLAEKCVRSGGKISAKSIAKVGFKAAPGVGLASGVAYAGLRIKQEPLKVSAWILALGKCLTRNFTGTYGTC